MAQPLLSLQDLSKYYINGQNVTAGLNKVSLRFFRGEFVAITGESGSGKSTLAHILSGILPYEDGELLFCGRPTSHYDSTDWEVYRRDNVAFISQNYGILPGATVENNVISALRLSGLDKQAAHTRARAILQEVELWELRKRRAAKLSSGQKQRLSIARALAKPCPVLIADEPTGNLDAENSEKVIRLLAQAARDRLVILITHEFPEAADYATRHISLQDGRISMDTPLREAYRPTPEDTPLREAYRPTPEDTPLREAYRPTPRDTSPGQAYAPFSGDTSPETTALTSETAPEKKHPTSARLAPPLRQLALYIAGLQLRSRPIWCGIVLTFFALTAFAVFVFLGTFLVALDDTSTRIYDAQAFLNGAKDRIVAIRKDGAPMTDEDYETILSLKYVDSLERWGYIADMSYAYRPDEDHTTHYFLRNYGSNVDPLYIETASIEFENVGQYLQTVPLFSGNDSFLTAGRLPENFYEIVAVGDKAMIGEEITVYLRDFRNWAATAYIKLDMTVVGVTDHGSGLYFHEDVGRALTLHFLGAQNTLIPLYREIPSSITYTDYRDAKSSPDVGPFMTVCEPTADSVLRPIADAEALISFDRYVRLRVAYPDADFQKLYEIGFPYINATNTEKLNIMGIHESTLPTVICVSPARFEEYLRGSGLGNGNQVSITIRDYAYTKRVISSLEKAGYYALSPYVLGSAEVDPELAAERMQTLAVCLGALIAVIALQLIVLRALFNAQTDSYRILSNIGLTYRTAGISILFQVLLFTLSGQLIGISGIWICSSMGVSRIANLTKYLVPSYWLVLSLIHLGASLFADHLITRGLKKKVYPLSARKSDLVIPEEVSEVSA